MLEGVVSGDYMPSYGPVKVYFDLRSRQNLELPDSGLSQSSRQYHTGTNILLEKYFEKGLTKDKMGKNRIFVVYFWI